MSYIEDICKIEDEIAKLITRSNLGVFNQSVYDKIEKLEFKLEQLKGDNGSVKWRMGKDYYKFKCTWIGRKFRCMKTGEELTILETVTYGSFFEFGECFIDAGDGYYCRFGGNIEEVK